MISQNHSNRRAYNWLIYDVSDFFIEKHAGLLEGDVYDLGSGESPYKGFFLKHANEYISVDWAGSFHETTANIIADLNKMLPIDSCVADTVVSFSVLEHLYAPQQMLNEAFRILKPKGNIVLQVPWQWWVHEAPHDYFRYTQFGLKHLFQQAGFTDVNVEAQTGFFSMLILKMNYFSLRFIRGPRLLQMILRFIFHIFWYMSQKFAPYLDKLDNKWELETVGYFVTARKP